VAATVECPRCKSPVDARDDGAVDCALHGRVAPLRRAGEVGYDDFAELVQHAGSMPTYLPWPMSPGWTIADFGHVGRPRSADATFTTTVGTSDLDGPVEVTVVSEDPGVGLGSRVAGVRGVDPGHQAGRGPQSIRVRAGGRSVPLWMVECEDGELLERAVFAGEAEGRWLWVVVRPASAALLLRDEWLLADVTSFGPGALEMPFGGPRPAW
jgi:hypothetical protein